MSDHAVTAGQDKVPDPLMLRKSLRDSVVRKLGKRGEADADLVVEAVEGAARTYAKHDADRSQVMEYRGRRYGLARVSAYAKAAADSLEGLDVMSSDHLKAACVDVDVARFVSELRSVATCSARIASTIQKTGKPRDVIEENWILSVWGIYRTFFAVGGRNSNLADFRRFLLLCRPAQFRGGAGRDHGALTPRQIERALTRTPGKKKTLLLGLPD